MITISYEEALKRFQNEQEVYLLYEDDTEGLAEEEASIHKHRQYGGEFGYEEE